MSEAEFTGMDSGEYEAYKYHRERQRSHASGTETLQKRINNQRKTIRLQNAEIARLKSEIESMKKDMTSLQISLNKERI